MKPAARPDLPFEEFAAGLQRGDFSWLEPLFVREAGASSVEAWLRAGRFAGRADLLNEALTCACFVGATGVAERLLDEGADLVAGNGTGLNGFHWAANRGNLDTVRMLLARRLPLEVRSCYDGTVLGSAVWAAVHEPKPAHPEIIEMLLAAGARLDPSDCSSGDPRIDAILERHHRS